MSEPKPTKEQIKIEYINGTMSYDALDKKYGLGIRTCQFWSKEEKKNTGKSWSDERKEHNSTIAEQTLYELQSKKVADNVAFFESCDNKLRMIANLMLDAIIERNIQHKKGKDFGEYSSGSMSQDSQTAYRLNEILGKLKTEDVVIDDSKESTDNLLKMLVSTLGGSNEQEND